jgi:hypothetical protein
MKLLTNKMTFISIDFPAGDIKSSLKVTSLPKLIVLAKNEKNDM